MLIRHSAMMSQGHKPKYGIPNRSDDDINGAHDVGEQIKHSRNDDKKKTTVRNANTSATMVIGNFTIATRARYVKGFLRSFDNENGVDETKTVKPRGAECYGRRNI
jgi:hypothetical protein